MADEGAVDVDERKHPEPAADSAPPLVAAHTKGPATQEAYGAYARHCLHCRVCADVDAEPCPTAGQLRRAWVALTDAAFRRLTGETA